MSPTVNFNLLANSDLLCKNKFFFKERFVAFFALEADMLFKKFFNKFAFRLNNAWNTLHQGFPTRGTVHVPLWVGEGGAQ